MEYEWDEAKRLSNLEKHGIDFRSVPLIDWDSAIQRHLDYIDGEERIAALAFLGVRLIAIVYTVRDGHCRIISMRRATRYEYRMFGNG